MKNRIVGLVALFTLAMALSASTATATTLELGGVTKNETLTITASLHTGTSLVLARTDGSLANTCTTGQTHGNTTLFTGQFVTGVWTSKVLEGCERPITVHKPGKFFIEHEPNTTSAYVFSEEAETTVSTPLGTVNCKTGAGTKIGTLTGTSSGFATWHINGVVNCGFLLPSATWKGAYVITVPNALGVSA